MTESESKIVLVFGTFDGLHEGHKNMFEQAKKLGSKLVVVVARDETVDKVKGRFPRIREQERMQEVIANAFVDEARLGHKGDKYKVIEETNPDVICLGYDQRSFTDELGAELEKRGLKPSIVRLEAYKPEKYKSSLINGKN